MHAPLSGAAESPASVKNADQYVASGNLKAAEIELRNAIRESPQDPMLRSQLARVYLQLGDPISAEREARAARERNGKEADYLPVLLDALLRQGKFADLADLVKPGNRAPALESKVRLALGIAAAGLHDRAKAEAMLHDAIRLDPERGAAKDRLGADCWRRPTRPKRTSCSTRRSPSIRARSRRCRSRENWREPMATRKAAMSHFDAALKIDPKNVAVRLSRASLNIAEGKYKAADEDLDPILKANPDNFMANYLRAFEHAKQQQYAAADRSVRPLVADFLEVPGRLLSAGSDQDSRSDNMLRRKTILEQIPRPIVPGDARAARLAATAALRQRAPARAIEYLKPVVDQSPRSRRETLTLLGNAYMASGKPELALQQFEKAAAVDPGNPAIKTRMAISEIGAGQGKEGLAELERVFDTQSGAPVAGPTLVLTQLRAGQVDKAAQVAAALVKRDRQESALPDPDGHGQSRAAGLSGGGGRVPSGAGGKPDFAPARRDLAAALSGDRTSRTRPRRCISDALAKKSG